MANEFEFELANGQKVYTGMKQPETRPLLFAESTSRPFTIEEAAELVKDPKRARARRIFKWMLNQGRRSSCNAYAADRAFRTARIWAGHDDMEFAPEFLYALINSGQDQGSLLPDGMRELCNSGLPPRDMVPYESYQMSDMSIEAKRVAKNYRAYECEQMPTGSVEKHWAMMICSVLRNQPLVTAVHVGDRFMSVDASGTCGFDRGAGNHAVPADDVSLLTENPKSWADFVLDMPNSWGKGFGQDGRGLLTIKHSAEPMKWHATYCVRSVTTDPQAANPFLKS